MIRTITKINSYLNGSNKLLQCWKSINDKLHVGCCLVADAWELLTRYLSRDIRVSLLFSMLQQMRGEDKCEQVQ